MVVCYILGFSCLMWSWAFQLRRSLFTLVPRWADQGSSSSRISSSSSSRKDCLLLNHSFTCCRSWEVLHESSGEVWRKGKARTCWASGQEAPVKRTLLREVTYFAALQSNKLWDDWRSVKLVQLQRKSMDSLLWIYWIIGPWFSQTGHLNKELWSFSCLCHQVPIILLVS